MNDTISEYVLNDGLKLPAIGLGTYRLNGREGVESIKTAVSIGYRLIDSAFNYENEGAVGAAVKECSIPRSELLITSKLPGRHHKYSEALYTVEESLFRAGLDYYDLYLIHWPNPITDLYVEAWQAMIEAKKRGLIRSIGVCNFLPHHIERLAKETGVLPSVNQIELQPYYNQQELRSWNAEHGIVIESWSPLGRANNVLQEPVIAEIAKAHGKTISQVILRWHIQLRTIPIPKSSSPARLRENFEVFDFSLTGAEMSALCALTREDGRTNNQDPNTYEEF
ncbi:MAG: 2,5-diketo-D-gluconic acid reductase [Firmicutes bacterium HGW-Firmicutes-16]|nr:MAG: 2,5-diketo-D-gluconic acid reductase [Firmicutes bacterium HGW-Firmicutes-16]